MNDWQGADPGGMTSVIDTRPKKAHGRKEEIKRPSTLTMTSSAGGNTNFDDRSSNPSSSGEVVQTAAEKAREKKLRDDPMAEVLGPLFVSCKRCGGRIKLSPKSTYDPFHWQKHRERCLRKPANVVRLKKLQAEGLYTPPAKKAPKPPGRAGPGSATPPLTTDDDDEVGGPDHVKKESPSPGLGETTSPPNMPSAIGQPNVAFEDYLIRSRRKMTRDSAPLTRDNWTAWNWSQLRAPVWVVASYPDGADDDDDPMMDDVVPTTQSRDSVATVPRRCQMAYP